MEVLSEITINIEGQNSKEVNFTEAALLLQGTASVYSKKVEFLWQNVLKMLDLLASRKALLEEDDEDVEKVWNAKLESFLSDPRLLICVLISRIQKRRAEAGKAKAMISTILRVSRPK